MSYNHLLQQSYKNKKPMAAFLSLYYPHKKRLFVSLILFLIKHSPVWILPIVTAGVINAVTEPASHEFKEIWFYAGIGLIAIVQNVPIHCLFVQTISKAIRRVEHNLRYALVSRLQQLSISYHKQTKTGTLQSKVLRDVESIELLTVQLFNSVPAILSTIAAALIVTAFRAPLFLLFYLIAVPFAILLRTFLRGKIAAANHEFRRSIEDMSGKVSEMLRMIPVTRAHSVEHEELDQVTHKLDKVKHRGKKLDMVEALFKSLSFLVFTLFNLIALVVAVLVYHYEILPIGIGDIVLLTGYFQSITGAVMQLLNTLPQIMKGFESIKSIGEVLECPDIEENEGKKVIPDIDGRIRFESVSYKYPESSLHAVNDFSLDVNPGENIAIVGPSGSGKSTIIQMVIGFLRPSQGSIYVDSHEISLIDLRSYRRFISVVGQETMLFDSTIRDNIVYGDKDISDEQIFEAIEKANLADFINSLPDNIYTRIHENGARLSGGQKQRIAIARALIRDPQILILDEATSALDVASEALIQDALSNLVKGRTTFTVAHRLSTIKDADRIVVLEDGRTVEMGTHKYLLELGGHYARMHDLQAPR